MQNPNTARMRTLIGLVGALLVLTTNTSWAQRGIASEAEQTQVAHCRQVLRAEGSSELREERLVESWVHSLSANFFEPNRVYRAHPPVSRLMRFQYGAAVSSLKQAIKDAYSQVHSKKRSFEQALTKSLQVRSRSLPLKLMLGKAHRTVILGASEQYPKLNLQMKTMAALANPTYESFTQAFNNLREEFGPELFDEEVFRTALMNVYAMRLFRLLDPNNTSVGLPAIYSAALLHPIFDRAEDQGQLTKESLVKVSRAVLGVQTTGESRFEKAVLSLIQEIYTRYPPDAHPRLKWLFNSLLSAQIESESQKTDQALPSQLIFRMTAMKGGLSTSLFAYVALGGLNDQQFEFYFRAGTIFQLLDDLNDSELDRRDGIKTLFSGYDDPNSYVKNLARLTELVADVNKISGASSDFLAISFFFQAIAGIGLLPERLQDEIFLQSQSYYQFVEANQLRSSFVKLTKCMRFSLHQMASPFFQEVESFLWKGQRNDQGEDLPDKYRHLIQAVLDSICRADSF